MTEAELAIASDGESETEEAGDLGPRDELASLQRGERRLRAELVRRRVEREARRRETAKGDRDTRRKLARENPEFSAVPAPASPASAPARSPLAAAALARQQPFDIPTAPAESSDRARRRVAVRRQIEERLDERPQKQQAVVRRAFNRNPLYITDPSVFDNTGSNREGFQLPRQRPRFDGGALQQAAQEAAAARPRVSLNGPTGYPTMDQPRRQQPGFEEVVGG